MKVEEFQRYRRLYQGSPSAKRILVEQLGLDANHVPPLSIAHGVDMNHTSRPINVDGAEPIHWSFNESIHERARLIKPDVRLPHPWLMLLQKQHWPRARQNGKSLVIGAPPSRTNDTNLLAALKRAGISAPTVLVKSRGAYASVSTEFWACNGVATVTAGDSDAAFYQRLLGICLEYEYVVSPVLSSAIFFAAAVGAKVVLLEDYSYCSYSPVEKDFRQIAEAPIVKDAVRLFLADGATPRAEEYGREILGASYLADDSVYGDRYFASLESCHSPLFVPVVRGPVTKWLHSRIALASGRTTFLRTGLRGALWTRLFGVRERIYWKRINLIDMVKHGATDRNFAMRALNESEKRVASGRGADE